MTYIKAPNFPLMRAPKVGGMKNIFSHTRNYHSMAGMHLKSFWDMTPHKETGKISFQEEALSVMIEARIIRLKDEPTFCVVFEDNSALILSNFYNIQSIVQPMVFTIHKIHAHNEELIVAHAKAWQKFMRNKTAGKDKGPDIFFQSFNRQAPAFLKEAMEHFATVLRVLFPNQLNDASVFCLNGAIPNWAGKWHAQPSISIKTYHFNMRDLFSKNPHISQSLTILLNDLIEAGHICVFDLIGYEIAKHDIEYNTPRKIRNFSIPYSSLSNRYNNDYQESFEILNFLEVMKDNDLYHRVHSPSKSLTQYQKEALKIFSQYKSSRIEKCDIWSGKIKREDPENKTSHQKMAILAKESASFSWIERYSPQCLSLLQSQNTT